MTSAHLTITLPPQQLEFILGTLRRIDTDLEELTGGEHDHVRTQVLALTRAIYTVLNDRHQHALDNQ